MAGNILTSNPIQLDTTGATSEITADKEIIAIAVIASADTWSCVLHDAASGNVIFQADSAIANHRFEFISFAKPYFATGIYYTTGTNIALVLIYTT